MLFKSDVMSKLLVSCDDYCYCANGQFYLRPFGDILLKRYLAVFDTIKVVIRTRCVDEKDLGVYRIPVDSRIEVVPIPFFQGPIQYIKEYRGIKRSLINVTEVCDACIVRLPSGIAFKVYKIARRCKLPIGVEVVANPQELSQTGGIISRLCWKWLHLDLKRCCAYADAVSYVTEHTLQKIYQAKREGCYTTYYSSVELPSEHFTSPRSLPTKKTITLCHISNPINNLSKGHDVFIRVIKKLRDSGYDVVGRVAGEGSLLPHLKAFALEQGVEDYVIFDGFLQVDELRKLYIESDIMLFPTLTEGLPRVIIEAIATGMPCLSTPVGGIPELLSADDLFNPKDVDGFTKRIIELISDDNVYTECSNMYFTKAQSYASSELSIRRFGFYNFLKSQIE